MVVDFYKLSTKGEFFVGNTLLRSRVKHDTERVCIFLVG